MSAYQLVINLNIIIELDVLQSSQSASQPVVATILLLSLTLLKELLPLAYVMQDRPTLTYILISLLQPIFSFKVLHQYSFYQKRSRGLWMVKRTFVNFSHRRSAEDQLKQNTSSESEKLKLAVKSIYHLKSPNYHVHHLKVGRHLQGHDLSYKSKWFNNSSRFKLI